ncbi:MAG: metallophosphoesterase [Candidatus Kapabacteria bacterium]|nr:metallophosphoesterase [Candidatus Kapabacteria bacterium]
MKEQPNIIAFSIVLGLVLMALDAYVLGHWTRFVQRHSMNRWWHRSMWLTSLTMFSLYWYVVYRRHFFRMDGVDVVLMGLFTLWSMPKLAIGIVLLVKDAVRACKAAASWLMRRFRSTDSDVVASAEDASVMTRRDFFGKAGWSLSAVPYVLVGNGMYRTLYDFQVYELDVVIPNLPRAFEGMRLAQISDIHAGSFPDHRPFQEVRRILAMHKPDMIAITGDFVNAKPSELAVIDGELQRLHAPEGVYASLGNHDHYNTDAEHADLVKAIRSRGIDLLVNERRILTAGSERLVIAGTDNTGFKQRFARLEQALGDATEEDAVILLAHDPTFWEREVVGSPVGLMLAGHTHGGQLGVQLMGFEWSPAQYVYKQWAGLYAIGAQHVYVNRGIGTVGPPMRIGIPPEITMLTLRRPAADRGLA